jgi:hypothetical protein
MKKSVIIFDKDLLTILNIQTMGSNIRQLQYLPIGTKKNDREAAPAD